MPRLSIGEIQQYLAQAGWPDDLIPKAAAVFYYESGGGQTDIEGDKAIGGSWGLAQIYTVAHPEYTITELKDPLRNLQIAWQIYQKQGWNAWKNTAVNYPQRYQQYMRASLDAWNGQGGSSQTSDNTEADNTDNTDEQPTEDNTGKIILGLLGLYAASKII